MTHTVLIMSKVRANTDDSFVRPVYATDNLDNGWIFSASAVAATSGSLAEVFKTTAPQTGSLVGLWMMAEPELPFLASGTNKYNGLGQITDFYVSASTVATAIKPMAGDIITLTADAFDTAPSAYAIAVSGTYKWTASATDAGDVVTRTSTACLRYLSTTYIPFADGTIGSSRLTAYRMEVVRN